METATDAAQELSTRNVKLLLQNIIDRLELDLHNSFGVQHIPPNESRVSCSRNKDVINCVDESWENDLAHFGEDLLEMYFDMTSKNTNHDKWALTLDFPDDILRNCSNDHTAAARHSNTVHYQCSTLRVLSELGKAMLQRFVNCKKMNVHIAQASNKGSLTDVGYPTKAQFVFFAMNKLATAQLLVPHALTETENTTFVHHLLESLVLGCVGLSTRCRNTKAINVFYWVPQLLKDLEEAHYSPVLPLNPSLTQQNALPLNATVSQYASTPTLSQRGLTSGFIPHPSFMSLPDMQTPASSPCESRDTMTRSARSSHEPRRVNEVVSCHYSCQPGTQPIRGSRSFSSREKDQPFDPILCGSTESLQSPSPSSTEASSKCSHPCPSFLHERPKMPVFPYHTSRMSSMQPYKFSRWRSEEWTGRPSMQPAPNAEERTRHLPPLGNRPALFHQHTFPSLKMSHCRNPLQLPVARLSWNKKQPPFSGGRPNPLDTRKRVSFPNGLVCSPKRPGIPPFGMGFPMIKTRVPLFPNHSSINAPLSKTQSITPSRVKEFCFPRSNHVQMSRCDSRYIEPFPLSSCTRPKVHQTLAKNGSVGRAALTAKIPSKDHSTMHHAQSLGKCPTFKPKTPLRIWRRRPLEQVGVLPYKVKPTSKQDIRPRPLFTRDTRCDVGFFFSTPPKSSPWMTEVKNPIKQRAVSPPNHTESLAKHGCATSINKSIADAFDFSGVPVSQVFAVNSFQNTVLCGINSAARWCVAILRNTLSRQDINVTKSALHKCLGVALEHSHVTNVSGSTLYSIYNNILKHVRGGAILLKTLLFLTEYGCWSGMHVSKFLIRVITLLEP